jgi:hypothetical protein
VLVEEAPSASIVIAVRHRRLTCHRARPRSAAEQYAFRIVAIGTV